MTATILQLTTVHSRTDMRIFYQRDATACVKLPHKVLLMVADGIGNVDEEQCQVSIHDLGISGAGAWAGFCEVGGVRFLPFAK